MNTIIIGPKSGRAMAPPALSLPLALLCSDDCEVCILVMEQTSLCVSCFCVLQVHSSSLVVFARLLEGEICTCSFFYD